MHKHFSGDPRPSQADIQMTRLTSPPACSDVLPLIKKYGDRRKLYLSWDAASWHISKQLFARIDAHNSAVPDKGGPLIETAPLPAGAQFLNVVESVFSGMARAIIHNSDYKSMDVAKAAIDRYFGDRNAYFQQHPKRARKKIWAASGNPQHFLTRITARIRIIDKLLRPVVVNLSGCHGIGRKGLPLVAVRGEAIGTKRTPSDVRPHLVAIGGGRT